MLSFTKPKKLRLTEVDVFSVLDGKDSFEIERLVKKCFFTSFWEALIEVATWCAWWIQTNDAVTEDISEKDHAQVFQTRPSSTACTASCIQLSYWCKIPVVVLWNCHVFWEEKPNPTMSSVQTDLLNQHLTVRNFLLFQMTASLVSA